MPFHSRQASPPFTWHCVYRRDTCTTGCHCHFIMINNILNTVINIIPVFLPCQAANWIMVDPTS